MSEKKLNIITVKIGDALLKRLNAVSPPDDKMRSSLIREALEEKLDAMERSEFDTPPIIDPYYGQYREYEIGGQRVAVAITPLRNSAYIIFHVLGDRGRTLGMPDLEANKAHPVVAAWFELDERARHHHWETPEFRDFCRKVGLDPDAIKPQFAEEHQALALALMERSCRIVPPTDLLFYSHYIEDLLDLMRTGANGEVAELESKFRRCCRDFVEWEGEPEGLEILTFLKGFDLSRLPWIERHPLDDSED